LDILQAKRARFRATRATSDAGPGSDSGFAGQLFDLAANE
jgi:hypothetical protein